VSGRREFVGRLAACCAGCTLARAVEAAPLQDPFAPGAGLRVEEGGLNPTPARWFKTLPDGWVQCEVCPRACRISEDERGTCGTRENRKGRLYTLVHSRPCALAVDPVEKKPFFHVLPGAAALSLATAGCNLDCKGCQNWEIAQARPEQVPSMSLTPADVVMMAKRKGAPLVACTYNEPVVFSEYVLDIAVAGRAVGVRTVMISNGYVQAQPLADLCREIAAYKVDLKGFDAGFFKQHTGGDLKHVLDTLRLLRKHGTWTEIVCLVIPTQNDSEAENRALARFVRDEVGQETPLHFTRFHPSYRLQNLPSTPVATLERCRSAAMAEDSASCTSATCPATGRTRGAGLQGAHPPLRHGGGENRLRDGTCPGAAGGSPASGLVPQALRRPGAEGSGHFRVRCSPEAFSRFPPCVLTTRGRRMHDSTGSWLPSWALAPMSRDMARSA
jgi:pyruvate formate lyase activating enzyme